MARKLEARGARRPGVVWLATAGLAVSLLAACGGGGDGRPLELRTLSTRADLVSGGDALVEVVLPGNTTGAGLKVTADGRDVTSAFSARSDGALVGLVTGLDEGENVIEATASNVRGARLTITNAPRSGPVLSGAQAMPFYCATPTAQPPNGNMPGTLPSGLAGQPDANCNIAAETKLYYRTTTASTGAGACSLALPDPSLPAAPPANPCFKPYTVGTTPADMATATTDSGVTMPFIVRLERGTINRGIYDIAVLFDPARDWSARAPQPQWIGKVYYTFGASTGQPRRQARPASAWSGAEEQLKRGYLVATNSLSDSARNSNRISMSETVLMMKEHIGDTYGAIRFTIGTGCSGGSINSNTSLSIFPGLLDGVVTWCTYPDSETTAMEVGDCVLLVEAYQKAPMATVWTNLGLTQAQINEHKAAINGHVDQTACHGWYNAFGANGRAGLYAERLVADNLTGALVNTGSVLNNCELPNTAVYDPANPAATANLPRCNAWSWAESIWGRVPGSTAANDTRDNVGIQYGLKALLAGSITAEEFVTLNELVGGTDRDSTPRADRSVADAAALEVAYRAGIVASGRNLAKAPIIDMRGWDDSALNVPPGTNPPVAPIHHQWFSFAVRDRIIRDAGDAGNQALWRFARGSFAVPPGTMSRDAFAAMDKWLGSLVATVPDTPIEARVRATRPAETRDFCLLPADPAQNNKVFDPAVCDADPFLKPSASPRQVAGGPRTEDILKCQLKPLAQSDYPAATFTAGQFARLQAVFPGGVCDWGRDGVGQQAAVGPLTFRAGPGGQPLGDAPVSSGL